MTIKQTIIPVCIDCHIYSTGDLSPFDLCTDIDSALLSIEIEHHMKDLLEEYPEDSWILPGEKIEEHSIHSCRCCGSQLHGERFELLITTNN